MAECLVTVACCWEGCGHVVSFKTEVERRLRRTHEFWKCPAGHEQHFAGSTDEEKKIAKLKTEVSQLKRMLEGRQHLLEYWHERTTEAEQTCIWQGCEHEGMFGSVAALKRHMIAEHGMPTRKSLEVR